MPHGKSTDNGPVDPQIVLETAIATAILEYETVLPRTVIGISITRIDRKLLEVGALVIPSALTSRKSRSRLVVGSMQITTKETRKK